MYMTMNSITLRPLEPEDLELLYTIENDRSLWWLSSQSAPYSKYHLRDYIANNDSDIFRDGQVRFVVEDDGKAVGLIDLFDFNPMNMRAEMGVAILKSARGRGVASAAIAHLVRYAHDVVHLHQIYCIVPESNEASIAMLRKADFLNGGTLKEWVFMSDKYENAMLMQLFL